MVVLRSRTLDLIKFGIVMLIMNCIFLRCGVYAADVVSNSAKADISLKYSTGFATQSEENFIGLGSNHPVLVEIVDGDVASGYSKHVEICNVPENFKLNFVKIWPHGFSKKEEASFVSAGVDKDGNIGEDKNSSCSEIKFDSQLGRYKFSFNPVFEGEGSNDWQEGGFDFLLSFTEKNGDSEQVRQLELVAAKYDSWRDDVRLYLSDNDENCRWLKKIQITGIPDDVKLRYLRIWPVNSTMIGSSVFSPVEGGETDRSNDRCSSDIRFDKAKNCYEFLFNPVLDCGIHWVDNVDEANLNLNGFNVLACLCEIKADGSEGEAIWPLEFKVSNENLKQPSNLSELKNFSVGVTKNNLGEDCLEIKGLPGKVSEVYVDDVFWSSDDKKINEQCEHDDGVFIPGDERVGLVRFEPKTNRTGGSYGVVVSFLNDEGYSFFLCKKFRID